MARDPETYRAARRRRKSNIGKLLKAKRISLGLTRSQHDKLRWLEAQGR